MSELTVRIITATLPWEVSRKSMEVESQAGGVSAQLHTTWWRDRG